MLYHLLTAAGVVGSSLIIYAYFAIQRGWLSANDLGYPALNLIGAILILLSLITAWNLPAFVIETFWAAISIYGLIRSTRRGMLLQKAEPYFCPLCQTEMVFEEPDLPEKTRRYRCLLCKTVVEFGEQ